MAEASSAMHLHAHAFVSVLLHEIEERAGVSRVASNDHSPLRAS